MDGIIRMGAPDEPLEYNVSRERAERVETIFVSMATAPPNLAKPLLFWPFPFFFFSLLKQWVRKPTYLAYRQDGF